MTKTMIGRISAGAAALCLLAAPAWANHGNWAGIRATVTGTDGTVADIDVTGYWVDAGYSPSTSIPLSASSNPAIDFGDGATVSSTSLHVVSGGVPATARGSFSHDYGTLGSFTVRVAARSHQAGPSNSYFTPITGNFVNSTNSVTNTVQVNISTAPCAYNPFHGFLDDGECLPLCVAHPFHPELFANVPCLAGCSVDATGATVGTCVQIDGQPPAGAGPDPLAACLEFHPPEDCQGLATGNGGRVSFDEAAGSAAPAEARGSSSGGCAVSQGSAAGSALGLGFVALGLGVLRRRD